MLWHIWSHDCCVFWQVNKKNFFLIISQKTLIQNDNMCTKIRYNIIGSQTLKHVLHKSLELAFAIYSYQSVITLQSPIQNKGIRDSVYLILARGPDICF